MSKTVGISWYEKKAWYEKNKQKVIERNNERKRKARREWASLKKTMACTNCGENHPATLDFHHIDRHDPTNLKVWNLVRNGSFAKALNEIKTKCVVLCANCHRKHHHAERSIKRKKKSKNACTR